MIPETMKAFQFAGTNQVGVYDVPVPELKDENSILIKNDAAIICNMTDTHIYEASHEPNGPSGWDMPLPCTLGHESSGIVVKKGKAVTNVEIGDRVALCGWFESGSFAEYTMASGGFINLLQQLNGLLSMPILSAFIVGLLFRNVDARAAIAAVVVGETRQWGLLVCGGCLLFMGSIRGHKTA
jgi:NADPH:quinone reductase-like Zn-dependent oxidoreductase